MHSVRDRSFLYYGLGIFFKFEYKNYIWNSFLEGE